MAYFVWQHKVQGWTDLTLLYFLVAINVCAQYYSFYQVFISFFQVFVRSAQIVLFNAHWNFRLQLLLLLLLLRAFT